MPKEVKIDISNTANIDKRKHGKGSDTTAKIAREGYDSNTNPRIAVADTESFQSGKVRLHISRRDARKVGIKILKEDKAKIPVSLEYTTTGAKWERIEEFKGSSDLTQAKCIPYAWGLADVNGDVNKGYKVLTTHMFSEWWKKVVLFDYVYIHNLAWDLPIILCALLKQEVNAQVWTNEKRLPKAKDIGIFYRSAYAKGKCYYCDVWINGKRTRFIDSFKRYPVRLDAIFNSLKKQFGYLWVDRKYRAKGEFNHNRTRYVGRLSSKARFYLESDIVKLQCLVRAIIESKDIKSKTVASFSMKKCKDNLSEVIGRENVEKAFASCDVKEIAEFIIKTNSGGMIFNNVNEQWYANDGTIQYRGSFCKLDINSLYPFIASRFKFPMGKPKIIKPVDIRQRSKDTYYYWKCKIKFKFAKDTCSMISDKCIAKDKKFSSKGITTRLTESNGDEFLYLSEPNMDFILENSIIPVECLECNLCLEYWACNDMFTEYLTGLYARRQKTKKEGKSAESEELKFQMNAFLGRFGLHSEDTGDHIEIRNGKPVIIKVRTSKEAKKTYGQLAICEAVCAWGRYYICNIANKYFRGKVLYGDTDSLFVAIPWKRLVNSQFYKDMVNKTEMGKFKVEEKHATDLVGLCAKTYEFYDDKGSLHTAAAGYTIGKRGFNDKVRVKQSNSWIKYPDRTMTKLFKPRIPRIAVVNGKFTLPARNKRFYIKNGVGLFPQAFEGEVAITPNNVDILEANFSMQQDLEEDTVE